MATDPDRERLRRTFDDVAERYDRIRPTYPPELVADLVRLAGLERGARVLEIGCGTGRLTVALAAAGLRVTAVELGPGLATVARRNLAPYPDARVVVAPFEDVPVADGSVDLVVAATSFHWIDETVRVAKSARVLRAGGALAVVDTQHVAGDSDFFDAAQDCYEAWDPATPPRLRLPEADDVPTARPELDDSPHVAPPQLRRYVRDVRYTTDQYLTLLLTYSGHLDLPAELRDGLLGCIRSLIDRRYGSAVTKRYLFELRVARRRDLP